MEKLSECPCHFWIDIDPISMNLEKLLGIFIISHRASLQNSIQMRLPTFRKHEIEKTNIINDKQLQAKATQNGTYTSQIEIKKIATRTFGQFQFLRLPDMKNNSFKHAPTISVFFCECVGDKCGF